ncbi:MAG: 2-hydroxyacid dehydrogenase [Flavobacteriales bacterium]|nr:2-hydroxyacid dehydrogenase [Flavobacteriales bacterium]
MKKILFLDLVHPILEERLMASGYVCEHDYTSPKQEVEQQIENYFGIVIRSRFTIDQSFLDEAKQLRFIARSGAGLENIDVAYAEQKGIQVFNSPEGNKDAVGEHAIGMLLMLFNQLKKGDAEVRKGIWDREGNRGLELSGKTVAIIGYGNMGSAFAEKLAGFGCTVLAYDKYKQGFGTALVKEADLNTIYREADVVSIHLPLSEETNQYVNKAFIDNFQNPIYLINTARGNNVSLNDLVGALRSGKVLGACLDVLEYESKSFEQIDTEQLPESFQYLRNAENVVLSPHVAGWTKESYIKLSTYLADKIEENFNN